MAKAQSENNKKEAKTKKTASKATKADKKSEKADKEKTSIAPYAVAAIMFLGVVLIVVTIFGYTRNKINEVRQDSYQGIDQAKEAKDNVDNLKNEVNELKKIADDLDKKIDEKVQELETKEKVQPTNNIIRRQSVVDDWKTVTNKTLNYRLNFPDQWEVETSSKDEFLILQPKGNDDFKQLMQIKRVLPENDEKLVEEKKNSLQFDNLIEEFVLSENVVGNYRRQPVDGGEVPIILIFTPKNTIEISFQSKDTENPIYQDLKTIFEQIVGSFEYISE